MQKLALLIGQIENYFFPMETSVVDILASLEAAKLTKHCIH